MHVVILLANSFKSVAVVLILCIFLYAVLTYKKRKDLENKLGISIRIKSDILLNQVKKDSALSDNKAKLALYIVYLMRFLFVILWLSVFAQMMLKDYLN